MNTKIIMYNFLAMFFLLFTVQPSSAATSPEVVGETALVIDGKNGQVLFEKNPHQKVYPASTTKILTAIIALENGRLDDKVTIHKDACNIEGSAVGLQEGEIISLEDLLYSLMLNSGNDSAVAIAHHVGGTVEGFVRMMNDKAAELGALNTHFNNPNGLPDAEHYSTAYDMALISRYAMQNPDFRKIVLTKTKIIERDYPGAQTYLENRNRLLWQYDGAIGIKTGYTLEARQCLISAVARQDRELIAVVMKSEGNNIWNDSKKLFDYCFNEFELVNLTEAGRYVTNVAVRYGKFETVPVLTNRSLSYDLPRDKQAELTHEVILKENISAPIKAGDKLGELAFYFDNQELGRVDLLARQELGRKWWAQWWSWFILAMGLVVFLMLNWHHNNVRRRRWKKYKMRKYYL